ncbi:MAG TPA: glycosyltransferase family 39 protein [Polyangiaceae bacterium]
MARFLCELPRAACVVLACHFVWFFVKVAAARAQYPYDLEWMESGMLEHVRRVLSGQQLYQPPSAHFVPFIYNPLFYYLSAVATWFVGPQLFALRLVSILATLASFALIFELVRRETGKLSAAVFAAGAYAGTYELMDAWFDLARVDTLATALTLATLLCARFARSWRGIMLSALLSWLAFEAKQPALALVPAVTLFFLLRLGLRQAIDFLLAAITLIGGSVLVFHLMTDGWYTYYAFRLGAAHEMLNTQAEYFWRREILAAVPIALSLGLFFIFGPVKRYSGEARVFYALFSATLVFMAFTSRWHSGSWVNDLMPAYAAAPLLLGVGAGALLEWSEDNKALASALTGSVVLLQLLLFTGVQRDWVPNASDLREGQRLLNYIAAKPGPVLMTSNSHMPRMVGKPTYAHGMAVLDVERSNVDFMGAKERLRDSIEAEFAARRWSVVLATEAKHYFSLPEQRYDRIDPPYVVESQGLIAKSGAPFKPVLVYVPRAKL